jgi:hypothetical protein
LQQGAQPGQALALIELAKEGYREVLRQESDDWAARYNLERAQRLVPDPDDADDRAARPQAQRRTRGHHDAGLFAGHAMRVAPQDWHPRGERLWLALAAIALAGCFLHPRCPGAARCSSTWWCSTSRRA